MRVLLKINLNGSWELTDGKKTEREGRNAETEVKRLYFDADL